MNKRLTHMIEELQNYKHEKNSLMSVYVKERLAKSFEVYNQELEQSIQYLTKKHEKSVLKRIQKIDSKSN